MGSTLRLGWPIWVGVVSENIERQGRFYRDVLKGRSDDPQYDRPRYQVAFAVDDIEAVRRELIARGVDSVSDIVGTPDIGGHWSISRIRMETSSRSPSGWGLNRRTDLRA
jgi:predicted enzyme related to lactoylglutathione lyase